MENEKKPSYGKATIGYGTPEQRELNMIAFVQADFKDHRIISVAELEDETIIFAIENPVSSGRAPHQSIRLGKESFVALLFTAHLFCQGKGIDLTQFLEEAIDKKDLSYSASLGMNLILPH